MTDKNDIMALNELTGIVHEYNGTRVGGVGSASMGSGIGFVPCGCEDGSWFEEAVERDTLTVIRRKHLERGIWEPAECVDDS